MDKLRTILKVDRIWDAFWSGGISNPLEVIEQITYLLFLKMAEQTGREHSSGVLIPTILSRQELADLTGTTIETAIRVMSRWQKQRMVLTERDGFVIADRAALEALALE